jgi:hypothetical protein
VSYLRRRGRSALVALAALPLLLTASPAVADPDGAVNEGPGYSVAPVPGGYEVTVELDEPLPVRGDAPTIVADGTDLGLATESPDRRSLSLVTTDPAVLDADAIEPGWSSTSTSGRSGARAALTDVPEAAAKALDVDPASLGDVPFEEGEYDFGQLSVPLANISGYRGEMQGKLYVPPRPASTRPSCCSTGATRGATTPRPTPAARRGPARRGRSPSRPTPATTAPPAPWPATATRSSRSAPTASTRATTRTPPTAAPRPAASSCSTP